MFDNDHDRAGGTFDYFKGDVPSKEVSEALP